MNHANSKSFVQKMKALSKDQLALVTVVLFGERSRQHCENPMGKFEILPKTL